MPPAPHIDPTDMNRVVDKLDTTVSHLQIAVDKLSTAVENINLRLISANTDIAQLRNDLQQFKGDVPSSTHVVHHTDVVDDLDKRIYAANQELTHLRTDFDQFKGDISPVDHIIHHRAMKLNENLVVYAKRAFVERIVYVVFMVVMCLAMYFTFNSVHEMTSNNQATFEAAMKQLHSINGDPLPPSR